MFHCGRRDYEYPEQRDKMNGWCPTKLDSKNKIERWGYCGDNCMDKRGSFMYANQNLLTDKECQTLMNILPKDEQEQMAINFDYELCAGKKHPFPNAMVSFHRKKKKKTTIEKEKEEAKKLKLEKSWEPTKYTYVPKKHTRISLGTKENYPFKWFIGGVDTCQGDSGGPLWRNIKVIHIYIFYTLIFQQTIFTTYITQEGNSTKATQIGVVSRGMICGGFNSPGVYTSVSKILDWIKTVVEKEMEKANYCKEAPKLSDE